MSTDTTNDGIPVHTDLWNACAGAEVTAFRPSDQFLYIPKGHADHCSGSLQVLSSLEYMPPILCEVWSVKLRADPMTDEVFAKVYIELLLEKYRSVETKPRIGEKPHMISRLVKVIEEPAHLQQLSLPRSFLGICSDQFTTFTVIDFAEKSWTFNLMFRDDHKDYLLTDDWASFVREKSVQVGDVVVFLRDRILDNTRFAVRRVSSVSVGRRMELNIEAFSKVHGKLSLHTSGTTITYYPNDVNSDFLVPTPKFQTALEFDWEKGVRVRKWNNTRELQGTITDTTFKKLSDSLASSMWKCLSVKWDEPGCFQRNTFSPWELLRETKTNSGTRLFGLDLALLKGKKPRKRRN